MKTIYYVGGQVNYYAIPSCITPVDEATFLACVVQVDELIGAGVSEEVRIDFDEAAGVNEHVMEGLRRIFEQIEAGSYHCHIGRDIGYWTLVIVRRNVPSAKI